MNFIKGNWFKLLLIAIISYAVISVVSVYRNQEDRKLWTQEQLKAYEVCINRTLPEANTDISKVGFTSYHDAFKATFRSCKNVSDDF